MSTSRKMNIAGLAVLFLLGTLVSWWPFIAATWKMRQFCSGLAVGMAAADVQARAAELGYEVSPVVDGRAVVDDPPSFGRRQCHLKFGAGGLVGTE
jgi:hypothetical protein